VSSTVSHKVQNARVGGIELLNRVVVFTSAMRPGPARLILLVASAPRY
jgi:hypothetical protein